MRLALAPLPRGQNSAGTRQLSLEVPPDTERVPPTHRGLTRLIESTRGTHRYHRHKAKRMPWHFPSGRPWIISQQYPSTKATGTRTGWLSPNTARPHKGSPLLPHSWTYCWWYSSAGQKVEYCSMSTAQPGIAALCASATCNHTHSQVTFGITNRAKQAQHSPGAAALWASVTCNHTRSQVTFGIT